MRRYVGRAVAHFFGADNDDEDDVATELCVLLKHARDMVRLRRGARW